MQDVIKRIYDYSLEEIMGERFGRYSKAIIQGFYVNLCTIAAFLNTLT